MADREEGVSRVSNLVWDNINKKWVREVQSIPSGGLFIVSISGITPVDGKLPVDTEIQISGDVIVEEVKIHSMPLTEVYISGTPDVAPYTDWGKLQIADDLVTRIQYNEPNTRTTVSGITYTSVGLGLTAYETFASGTNTITITRY